MIEVDLTEDIRAKHQALLDSLPTLTEEEFYKRNEIENICYCLDDVRASDDIEEYFEELCGDFENEQDVQDMIENAKNIEVYTKDRIHITSDRIKNWITSYIQDNYDNEIVDQEVYFNEELLEEFVKDFNKRNNGYIADKLIAKLDLSKQVREYIEEEIKNV